MTTRTETYMARVASHLPSLPSRAVRRDFIVGELAKWEERYDAFRAKLDKGGDPGDVTVWDFEDTLAALRKAMTEHSEFAEVTAALNKASAEMRGRLVSAAECIK